MQDADVSRTEESTSREVSPLQGLSAGVTAFVAGAVVAGSSHFAGTAKALEAEGVSRSQRLQALPTAAKALAVSTAACIGLGGLGYLALKHLGFDAKDTTEVSSLHDAVSQAEQQQALVRRQFQQRLQAWQSPKSEGGKA